MKKVARNHCFYILFTILMVTSSCVKEMDFDGVKDITLEPQMKIKLVKAEFTQDFMVQEFENNLPSSVPQFGYIPGIAPPFQLVNPYVEAISLSSEERILKYLVDGTAMESGESTPVLKFKFTNTVDSSFEFTIQLLDKDRNVLKTKSNIAPYMVEASTNGEMEELNVSYSYSVESIKKAKYISVSFKMNPGSDLYKGTDNKLTIDASGIFNFSYDPSTGLP